MIGKSLSRFLVYCVTEFNLNFGTGNANGALSWCAKKSKPTRRPLAASSLICPAMSFGFCHQSPRLPAEIWRDYNGRATVECRIDKLKNELAADHFLPAILLCNRVGFCWLCSWVQSPKRISTRS